MGAFLGQLAFISSFAVHTSSYTSGSFTLFATEHLGTVTVKHVPMTSVDASPAIIACVLHACDAFLLRYQTEQYVSKLTTVPCRVFLAFNVATRRLPDKQQVT